MLHSQEIYLPSISIYSFLHKLKSVSMSNRSEGKSEDVEGRFHLDEIEKALRACLPSVKKRRG